MSSCGEGTGLQLDALPNNCLHRVFELLQIDTLCACAAVSRHFRSLVDDPLLWECVDLTDARAAPCSASRIGDASLRSIASKARGRMKRLVVSGCRKVSPGGVVFAALLNPGLVRASHATAGTLRRAAWVLSPVSPTEPAATRGPAASPRARSPAPSL